MQINVTWITQNYMRVIPSDDVDKFNSAMEEQGMENCKNIFH